MKTMNTLLATALVLSSVAKAEDSMLPPWLDVSGTISFDKGASKTGSDWNSRDLRVQDAELRFEILAREGVKLVIKAEFERQLNQLIQDEDMDAKLSQMLEEAYIQIETDKFGLPRAVITFGKHQMAFGQRIAELPMFKDSLLYKLNTESEMIGLTLALPTNFLKIVDEVAISLYETGAGDFKISDDKAVSIKLSKRLTQQVEMQISALMKEHGSADKETRASIGFVYTTAEGNMRIWAQGLVVDHNPDYAGRRYGATLGAARKLGSGVVVIEASVLEDVAKEVAVGYHMPVGSFLVLSPEVRYVMHESGDNETVAGIKARLEFGKRKGPGVGPR